MKHLIKYKIFESSSEMSEIFETVNDILLEMKDLDISVDSRICWYYTPSIRVPAIIIELESAPRNYFHLLGEGGILDCINRLVKYTKEYGFDIVVENTPDSGLIASGEVSYLSLDDFITEYISEELYQIEIILYKK